MRFFSKGPSYNLCHFKEKVNDALIVALFTVSWQSWRASSMRKVFY